MKFHNTGDRLYLTALYGGHDTHISSHVYGGALGFMHEEEKVKLIKCYLSWIVTKLNYSPGGF